MTAEIVIMNKQGIALAADSAVTISTNQNNKVYNSANKLFSLSKFAPVGIMIFDTAEFMGVPWEVLIKLYRNKLADTKFDKLKEYRDHFIDFLKTDFERL